MKIINIIIFFVAIQPQDIQYVYQKLFTSQIEVLTKDSPIFEIQPQNQKIKNQIIDLDKKFGFDVWIRFNNEEDVFFTRFMTIKYENNKIFDFYINSKTSKNALFNHENKDLKYSYRISGDMASKKWFKVGFELFKNNDNQDIKTIRIFDNNSEKIHKIELTLNFSDYDFKIELCNYIQNQNNTCSIYGNFEMDNLFKTESTTLLALYPLYLYKGKFFCVPNFLNNQYQHMIKSDLQNEYSNKYSFYDIRTLKGYLHDNFVYPWSIENLSSDFGFWKKSFLIGIDFDLVTLQQSKDKFINGKINLFELRFINSQNVMRMIVSIKFSIQMNDVSSSDIKIIFEFYFNFDKDYIFEKEINIKISETPLNELFFFHSKTENFMNDYEKAIKMLKMLSKQSLNLAVTFDKIRKGVYFQIICGYKKSNRSQIFEFKSDNLEPFLSNTLKLNIYLGKRKFFDNNIDDYFRRSQNNFVRFYELRIFDGNSLNSDEIENDPSKSLFSGFSKDIHSVLIMQENNKIIDRIKNVISDKEIKQLSDLKFENLEINLQNQIFVESSIDVQNCESFIKNICIKCVAEYIINRKTNSCEKCENIYLPYGNLCIEEGYRSYLIDQNQDNIKNFYFKEILSKEENETNTNSHCPNMFISINNYETSKSTIQNFYENRYNNKFVYKKNSIYLFNNKFFLNSDVLENINSSEFGVPINFVSIIKNEFILAEKFKLDNFSGNEISLIYPLILKKDSIFNSYIEIPDYNLFFNKLSPSINLINQERKDRFFSNFISLQYFVPFDDIIPEITKKNSIINICEENYVYHIDGLLSSRCLKKDDPFVIQRKIKFMNSDFLLLINCEDNCLECKNNFQCKTCKKKFFLLNGSCLPCSEKCLSCVFNSNNCIEENPDFFEEKYEKIKNCEKQIKDICVECLINYTLHNNLCLKCSNFQYFDFDLKICKDCKKPCLSCNNSQICQTCETSFYLLNGRCEKCIDNCFECESDSKCHICIKNFEFNLNSNKCEEQKNQNSQKESLTEENDNNFIIPVIKEDSSNLNSNNQKNEIIENENIQYDFIENCKSSYKNSCLICFEKYFVNQTKNECLPCLENCKICRNSLNCLLCEEKYELLYDEEINRKSCKLINQNSNKKDSSKKDKKCEPNQPSCISTNCFNCVYCQKKNEDVCSHCSKCREILTPVVAKSDESIYIIFKNFIQFKLIKIENRISNGEIEYDEKLKNYVEELKELSIIQKENNFALVERENEFEFIIEHFLLDPKILKLKIGNLEIQLKKDILSNLSKKIKLENFSQKKYEPNQKNILKQSFSFFSKESNSNDQSEFEHCGKYFLINFKLYPEDVDFVMNGTFFKPLNVNILIQNNCSFIPVQPNIISKKNLNSTTFLILKSFMIKFLVTIMMSFLNFKDLIDIPLLMKKSFSDHVNNFFSVFLSFDCNEGFEVFNEFESLKETQNFIESFFRLKLKKILSPEEYIQVKNEFTKLFSEKFHSSKTCLNKVLLTEIITIGFIFVHLLLVWLLKIILFFNKKFKKKKVFMKIISFVYRSAIIFCLTLFFDQLNQVLNSVIFLNSGIFSINHFFIMIGRTLTMFYGFVFADEVWDNNNEIKVSNIYFKNSIFYIMTYTFRKWNLFVLFVIFCIQLVYFLDIYYFTDTKNRKNWNSLFQEFFFLVYLTLIPDFVFEENIEESVSDSLFLILYLNGFFLSSFMVFFDIFDQKLQHIRKIKIEVSSLLKKIERRGKIFRKTIRTKLLQKYMFLSSIAKKRFCDVFINGKRFSTTIKVSEVN